MYKGFILSLLMVFSVSLVQANESIEELTRLAEQGDPEAQYQLGKKYANGEGVEHSYEVAFDWYEKAANQRHREAQYELGMMYYDETIKGVERGEDYYKQASLWFKRAANQGHANAAFMLGILYEYGEAGIEKDEETALFWYRKSKEYGDEEAEDAIEDLKDKMSKQGSVEAQQNLDSNKSDQIKENKNQTQETVPFTILSQANESIEENFVRPLEKMAEEGNVEATFALGLAQAYVADMYEDGKGVKQSSIRTYAWVNVLASKGDSDFVELRDELQKSMTKSQIAEAKKKSQELAQQIEQNIKLASESKSSNCADEFKNTKA